MRKYFNIFFAVMFLSVSLMAQTQQIGANKVVVGNKTAVDKTLEFNINQGAANPKLKASASTNKLQFSQDGVTFKDVGSGSGSGGSGINLLTESGFESGINVGWTNSGGTYAAATSGTNLLYQTTSATFQSSATAQFFESILFTVPEQLGNSDCLAKISYKGADANLFLTVLNASSVNVTGGVVTTLTPSATRRDAKLYFTCPAAGTQIKLRVQSTAASVVGAFDEAQLGGTDFSGVSGITSDVNYSPVYTGFGVPTSVDIKFSRTGKKLKILGRFAMGTTTATTASVSLPNGWTVSNKYTSSKIFGLGNRLVPTAATKNYSVIASPNDTTLKFSANGDTQTPNPISPINGTDIGSSGQELVFSAEMEINEFPESELAVNSKCPNDIACENVFTAQFSSAGVLLSENLDWINGNATNPSAGNYAIVFNSGIFTTTPICIVNTAVSNNFNQSGTISSVSFSNIGVVTGAGGIAVSLQFNVICQKTGADFKVRQNIQGFLTSTITSAANNIRLETVDLANCTTSPCTILSQTGVVTTVTRSSAGRYAVNILAGAFSAPPLIFPKNKNTVLSRLFTEGTCSTTILCNFSSDNTSAVATDADFSLLLIGPR